jgi:RNA-directed DNA polymerase
MDRVRRRIGDKRVLALVKAFLKAGVLGEDQVMRDTLTGTPQGGILSPLLANIALSVLDEHFMGQWESWGGPYGRSRRRAKGLANYRIVRYADLSRSRDKSASLERDKGVLDVALLPPKSRC